MKDVDFYLSVSDDLAIRVKVSYFFIGAFLIIGIVGLITIKNRLIEVPYEKIETVQLAKEVKVILPEKVKPSEFNYNGYSFKSLSSRNEKISFFLTRIDDERTVREGVVSAQGLDKNYREIENTYQESNFKFKFGRNTLFEFNDGAIKFYKIQIIEGDKLVAQKIIKVTNG